MAFLLQLNGAQSESLIDVPDWTARYGVTVHDLLATIGGRDVKDIREDQRSAAQALFILAGKAASVWRDNYTGAAVLTYKDTLPEDLAPLLVLDASGRVRHTYSDMETHRGLVRRLPIAEKDYAPLAINVWRTAGSKSAFHGNKDVLAKGIADAILTKPDEPWLIVVHKRDRKVGDVDHAIRRHLPNAVKPNVRTITWGAHMATNEYADVPNVVLAGTLFMRDSYYVALTHLAQDRPTAPGLVTDEEVVRTRKGEHANLVLQALCRGRVRKSNGSQCQPMTAYVIASARSGIGGLLPSIFPGCSVRRWSPATALAGKAKDAIDYVARAMRDGKTWITHADIGRAVDVDRRNYPKQIGDRADFIDAVRSLGLEIVKGPRGRNGLRVSQAGMSA